MKPDTVPMISMQIQCGVHVSVSMNRVVAAFAEFADELEAMDAPEKVQQAWSVKAIQILREAGRVTPSSILPKAELN